jgi:hypothetical protein
MAGVFHRNGKNVRPKNGITGLGAATAKPFDKSKAQKRPKNGITGLGSAKAKTFGR